MKEMKKKVLILGVALMLAAIGVSAALLVYYGRVLTTVTVEQSIQLEGPQGWMSCTPGYAECTTSDEVSEPAPGGERFCFKHKLRNRMSIEGEIAFGTSYSPDGEGISTTYYDVAEKTTILLENKNIDTWVAIEDTTKAELTYDTVNPIFDFTLNTSGLQSETEYVLLYYADYDPRFDKWGGDNPGALVATFTSDVAGNAYVTNNIELNMNLPTEPDWNINPDPDYCDLHNGFDDYDHCQGAKFWIVPKSDYVEGKVANWNPSAFLFETDLGVYFDCDLSADYYLSYLDSLNEIQGMTLASGEEKDFLICHDFDAKIMPGTYTIETRII